MKRLIFIVLVFAFNSSFSCDVCGCQMGGFTLGIAPQKTSNYVGLSYNYAPFTAEVINNSIYFPDEYSDDKYQSVDLHAKINLSERFSLFGALPYGFNVMDGNIQEARNRGLKDVMAVGLLKLIDVAPDSTNNDWQHLLFVGLGGKAPTGDFDLRDIETGGLINPNFQLGSGSWDGISMLTYKVKYKRIGLSTEQSFKYNFSNSMNYQFGNQYNLSANVFSWWFNRGVSFLPFAGVYYEWSGIHRDEDGLVPNTGGNLTFADIGALLIYNNWGVRLDAKAPLSQNFNTDHHVSISGNWRWQLTFRYYFEKNKME